MIEQYVKQMAADLCGRLGKDDAARTDIRRATLNRKEEDFAPIALAEAKPHASGRVQEMAFSETVSAILPGGFLNPRATVPPFAARSSSRVN